MGVDSEKSEKVNIDEMGTCSEAVGDSDTEELTKWGKFCQRHGINPNLIMLKITLFVMYGGKFTICVGIFCLKKMYFVLPCYTCFYF